ncbi:MAG: addiction module protein [Acidobacteriota bacterium]
MELVLEKMTISEELSAMERLWDDLCRDPSNVPSPQWHEVVLAERTKRVIEGKGEFIALGEAKNRVRTSTR